ncbi:MAG: hypothetical protein NTY38_10470, partial [Acidobacteria bacterium]|nr:hypothetical protein [Acidobacteriota bacterium]
MTRLFVLLPAVLTIGFAAEVAVSPDGPIRTLEAARDRAREIHRREPSALVTVRIASGVYELAETLVLGPEDSNTSFEAAPGSRAVVSGGRVIGNWTKTAGPEWKAPAAGGEFRQLFLDGRRAQRARTPNSGFYRLEGKPVPTPKIQLRYRGGDLRREWLNGPAEMFALMNWFYVRMPMAALDESAHTVTLAGAGNANISEADARYWIENTRDAAERGSFGGAGGGPAAVATGAPGGKARGGGIRAQRSLPEPDVCVFGLVDAGGGCGRRAGGHRNGRGAGGHRRGGVRGGALPFRTSGRVRDSAGPGVEAQSRGGERIRRCGRGRGAGG